MTANAEFQPEWCSHPGSTIRELLYERRVSVHEFANAIDLGQDDAVSLLRGNLPISREVACKLDNVLGGSEEFWLSREKQYQADFHRLQSSVSNKEIRSWLKELPVDDMISNGWIDRHKDNRDQFKACLRFFAVPNVDLWRDMYEQSLTAASFRTSQTYESSPGAISAWLRQGQILADAVDCEPWDRQKFLTSLSEIRAITREKRVESFLSNLTSVCANCGVGVIVLRAPNDCRASGATRFLSPEKAMILLSFRHLSDDHFWFTFFHEAGHLVLHEKSELFLEGLGVDSEKEEEANRFAEHTLIPENFRAEFDELEMTYRSVIRFARKVGIAPGIIVGQFQHGGRLARNKLNRLKKRYKWKD